MGIFKDLLTKSFTLNFCVTIFIFEGVGRGVRGDVHKYVSPGKSDLLTNKQSRKPQNPHPARLSKKFRSFLKVLNKII
jgi:hypothetical protein